MVSMQSDSLSKIHPMNGGNGLYSYTKNSTYQRGAIDAVKELIKEAILEKLDTNIILRSTNTIHITDMGCSVGPNTFYAVQNILEAIETKCRIEGLDHKPLEFQVFLNDQVQNDFNTLFASIPPNRQYYVASVPGSFHGRLFPNASLHIVHSSYAIQWLSQVPREVVDRSCPAWNKGRIHYSSAGDQTIKAYTEQFARDMDSFLHFRALEVVGGGFVILTIPGRLNGCAHSQVFSTITYDLLGSTLMDMAKRGAINENKVDSFNLPIYFPSPQELESAVERNKCFSIKRLGCIPQEKGEGTIPSKARMISSHMRAGMELLLKEHFGHQVLDELFESFTKKLEKSSVFHLGLAYTLFILLQRKQNV